MNGQIPVLMIEGKSLAEAWEKSLVVLNDQGCDLKTEYDKTGDPPSKDSTMTVVIQDPLSEPMIHKDFPGGLDDLQEYVMEVLDGIKDHCVRDPDPAATDTRWEYTYHQRLFRYNTFDKKGPYDQIYIMAEKLAETPHTRRAQAITWKVWEDNHCYDPPCLQSIWCRLVPHDNVWYLNMNVRFRSNDAYKAAFMNMFALIMLQQRLAQSISGLAGMEVRLGRYVHQADSYHLYGSYFQDFEERFLGALKTRSFQERTYEYGAVKPLMDEAIPQIKARAAAMCRSKS